MLKIHETMRAVAHTKCSKCGHDWRMHALSNKSANPTGRPGPQHCVQPPGLESDACKCRVLIHIDEDPTLCREE